MISRTVSDVALDFLQGGSIMCKGVRAVSSLVLCFIAIAAPSIRANWIPDGVFVITDCCFNQTSPKIASDGADGAIVVWQDSRTGFGADIYAQRVNAVGDVQWTFDGVQICAVMGEQSACSIVSDGHGGAIVAWQDHRSGSNFDIYAQRVNASGAVQWQSQGLALCTATENQWYPAIVSDGSGGAIVTWEDYRGGNYDIYAQRVSASGAVQWGSDGIAICAATTAQMYPAIVSDGSGGAIVTWWDNRNGGDWDIYAQRVNASGAVRWGTDGIAMCTAAGWQMTPRIASDLAGGAIVTWEDTRDGLSSDIYAQRVNAAGVVQWTPDGVPLCTATGNQMHPNVVSDGSGGAIVTWEDYRGGNYDIYAQGVDAAGAVQWTPDGVPICTVASNQLGQAIVSDGSGGAIITWQDNRGGLYGDIYAQQVNAAGVVQWTPDGIALCTATSSQEDPSIASVGTGGAIVAWQDHRSGSNFDIYAQFIDAQGRIGELAPYFTSIRDVPRDQGGKITLQWAASNAATYYSVWRRLPGGIAQMPAGADWDGDATGVPIDFEGKKIRLLAGAPGYAWEWLSNVPAKGYEEYALMIESRYDSMGADPGWQYFVVSAHTSDPFVYFDSAIDSGCSVDNLSPCAPLALAGEQSYSPAGLALTWNSNEESDLSRYALYRGLSEDFVPASANRMALLTDASFFDGDWRWNSSYYYKVSAIDVHGNESGFALLRPEDVTGTDTPKAPEASYLAQNYPNPFNPMTRIAFGLSAPGRVSLRIYDASGRLVRTIVEENRSAGHYVEIWDGRGVRGEEMASGVYFYRLDTGVFTERRKMILLR
jgi:hypothetical protein